MNSFNALSSAANYQSSTWETEATNAWNGFLDNVNAGWAQVVADWGVWSEALHTALSSF